MLIEIPELLNSAQLEKIPYMLIIGEKEQQTGAVAVRDRVDGDLGAMPVRLHSTIPQHDAYDAFGNPVPRDDLAYTYVDEVRYDEDEDEYEEEE